jgi:pyrimidine oxygenase
LSRARTLAAELGKPIRTYCMMTVITAPTDAEAQSRAQAYRDGLDEGAVLGMLESYGVAGNAMTTRAQGAFMTQSVVGSPATCAAKIQAFLRDCDIDGLMFVYDDYERGLRVTGREILPQLRKAFA